MKNERYNKAITTFDFGLKTWIFDKKSAYSFSVYMTASNALVHYERGFISIYYTMIVHYRFVVAAIAAFVLCQAQYFGLVTTYIAFVERLSIFFLEMHVSSAFGAHI